MGCALVLNHQLANDWFSEAGGNPVFPRFESIIDGGITAWYTMRINAIAEDSEIEVTQNLVDAMSAYEERDRKRCVLWSKKFIELTVASDCRP